MKKLKIISISLLSGLILLSTSSLAREGVVNAPSGLVLRKKASKSSSPITTVKDNATVEILKESGDWYQVKYGEYEGYLYAKYVDAEKVEEKQEEEEKNPNSGDENSSQAQNAKSDIDVHLIPSITSQTIGTLKKGAKIEVNYEIGNWVNINYGNTQGWVRKYFIYGEDTSTNQNKTETPEQQPQENSAEENNNEQSSGEQNTVQENAEAEILKNKAGYVNVSTSANIREKASTSSKIVNTLLKNTKVEILGEEGDFYSIQYHDIKGYISKSLISAKPVK